MDRGDLGRAAAEGEGVSGGWRRARRPLRSLLQLLLVGALANCSDAPPPPPIFEGAAPLRIASVERGELPTPQEIEQLIARLVEVAGGAERWRTLRFKRVEDLYLLRTGSQLGNQVIATTWMRPDQTVRVELEYRGGERELRVMLNREEFVHPQLGSLQYATGGTQQHVEWDWEVVQLPYNLLAAEELRPLPYEGSGADRRIGLAVKLPGLSPPFEAWIDPAGPVVVEVRTELPVTADLSFKTMARHRQLFSDWRRVDGVLLAHRREIHADDRRIGLAETRSYDLAAEIPDSVILPIRPELPELPK